MIPDLSVIEFLEQFEKADNAILIDSRKPEEVEQGALDKAININFLGDKFQSEILKLDKNKSYFVYCRSGRRSMNTCLAMQSIGISYTVNLDGGYLAFLEYNKTK